MKKWTVILVCLCLMLVCGCAWAEVGSFCDAIPQGMQEIIQRDHPDEGITDCILLTDTPMGDLCYVMSDWYMYGYLLKNGVWERWAEVAPLPQEQDTQLVFRRHAKGSAPGIQGACGLTYPDSLGFDILQVHKQQPGSFSKMMQFHWSGDDLSLVGWQPDDSDQFAIWQDGAWAFFNLATGKSLGSARIDVLREYGLLNDYQYLPHTLAVAQKMEAITQDSAKALFPEWTMAYCEAFSMGCMANAGYYRISDGFLTVRRIELGTNTGGIVEQTDSIPVPLSQTLLQRLQTEPAESLLDMSGYGNTFLTDDFFDQNLIPVTDMVLQNDLQSHGLMLLTKDKDGVLRLRFVEQDGDGYSVRTSQPLPEGTHLDLFHVDDDAVSLEWDTQDKACSFSRMADGNWTLGWATRYTDNSFLYGTMYCGILNSDSINGTQCILVGSHPWSNLFKIDFTKLPYTVQDAVASLNRNGWAVVNNPDPADRLHLRVKPDSASQSLGKFFNHTPVQVLSQRGDWSQVRIGLDGHLEGWMLTKYLTFGDAMDSVASASPCRILLEKFEQHTLFASAAMKDTTGIPFGRNTWIVGVVGDQLYVLLDSAGNTGYLPQSWFWDGNG